MSLAPNRSVRALQALAFAMAGVLFAASALAGVPYQWCVPMQRAQLHCCCPHEAADAALHDAPVLHTAPCCELHRIAKVPTTVHATLAVPTVAPAALVALIPFALANPIEPSPIDAPRPPLVEEPRAGPEPPLYALHRSYRN